MTLTADLRSIRRRLIRARLGTLEPHEADHHYAEDVAALLALLEDARANAASAMRAIRIEDRLRFK
jgi:hypothetical protein